MIKKKMDFGKSIFFICYIYNMLELNKIYNEDCLIGMQKIDDKSIDMICCDLPYGVLNKGNKSAKWDSIIPFDKLWEQYERIIKDDGVICLLSHDVLNPARVPL